jgi:hypothetical protein
MQVLFSPSPYAGIGTTQGMERVISYPLREHAFPAGERVPPEALPAQDEMGRYEKSGWQPADREFLDPCGYGPPVGIVECDRHTRAPPRFIRTEKAGGERYDVTHLHQQIELFSEPGLWKVKRPLSERRIAMRDDVVVGKDEYTVRQA